MKKIVLYLALAFSCQPYGKVTQELSPCDSNRLKIGEPTITDPTMKDLLKLFTKMKIINVEIYVRELERLVELSKGQKIEKSSAGLKDVSPLFKGEQHSLKTEPDYVFLVELIEMLSKRADFEDMIKQASEIYIKSRINGLVIGGCEIEHKIRPLN
jgi:hypothetical protein